MKLFFSPFVWLALFAEIEDCFGYCVGPPTPHFVAALVDPWVIASSVPFHSHSILQAFPHGLFFTLAFPKTSPPLRFVMRASTLYCPPRHNFQISPVSLLPLPPLANLPGQPGARFFRCCTVSSPSPPPNQLFSAFLTHSGRF